MKTWLRFVITDLLELLLVSVALVGIGSFGAVFAQTGDQLRTWSAVGSTCIPDDETPDTRYDVQVDGGYIEFKANVIGYNYFSCNVTSPIDAYAGQPEWNTFSLTFKDPDTCGYVQHFTVHSINAFIRGLPEAIDAQTLPLIQLLPMATMASQGHHTVLEYALTLTLNAIIQYRIGFYKTLMPTGSVNGVLEGIFLAAERDQRNRHILCFWENGRLQGILYDKAEEIARFREASLTSEEFRSQFVSLPLKPSKSELFSLGRQRDLPP